VLHSVARVLQVIVSGQLVVGTLLSRTMQVKLVMSGSLPSEPVIDIGNQRPSVSYVTDSSVVKAIKVRWKGEEAWSSDISISSSSVGMGHLTKVTSSIFVITTYLIFKILTKFGLRIWLL